MTFNVYEVEWERERERPGWQWRHVDVDGGIGATQISGSLYELQPGQRTFPYHWHVVEEEWLIVLGGEPTLRSPDGEQTLVPGDTVVFKTGPEGAHSIRNDTGEPVRLLMLSSGTGAEICFYPDSGKVGMFGPELRKILNADAELDYFDGEE
jgi:uncharacterized cupin superfamily protein